MAPGSWQDGRNGEKLEEILDKRFSGAYLNFQRYLNVLECVMLCRVFSPFMQNREAGSGFTYFFAYFFGRKSCGHVM